MIEYFNPAIRRGTSRQSGLKRFLLIMFSSMAVTAGILASSRANAQSQGQADDRDWNVTIGAGAIYAPDYEGSNDFQAQPFPFISVSYKDLAYIRGPEIGVNILRFQLSEDAKLKFGPIARYRRDRPQDRNRDLAGLGDVGTSIEVGGAGRIEIGRGWAQLSVAKDVAGGHDGLVAQVEAGIDFDLTDRMTLSASGSTSWADRKYMTSFFSVTPTQSVRSGLPVFNADKGMKDGGASLALTYRLTDHWLVTATGGYTRLLGDADRAPIVKLRGSPDQWQGGLFAAYHF